MDGQVLSPPGAAGERSPADAERGHAHSVSVVWGALSPTEACNFVRHRAAQRELRRAAFVNQRTLSITSSAQQPPFVLGTSPAAAPQRKSRLACSCAILFTYFAIRCCC